MRTFGDLTFKEKIARCDIRVSPIRNDSNKHLGNYMKSLIRKVYQERYRVANEKT